MSKEFLNDKKHFLPSSVLRNFFTFWAHLQTFHKFAAHFEQNTIFLSLLNFKHFFYMNCQEAKN